MKNNVLLFFLLVLATNSFSQNLKAPIGLHKSIAGYETGYYYFNKDSTFIFIGTHVNRGLLNKSPFIFSDTILKVGVGKWQVSDSNFQIRFEKFPIHPLVNSSIEYESWTKKPFDSLFITMSVTNQHPQSSGMAILGFHSNGKVINSDNKGNIKLAVPSNFGDSTLEVVMLFHEKQVINLTPGNNVHRFKIKMEKENTLALTIIQNINHSYNLFHQKKPSLFVNDRRFMKDEQGLKKILEIIGRNIKYNPQQKQIFDFLIRLLTGSFSV